MHSVCGCTSVPGVGAQCLFVGGKRGGEVGGGRQEAYGEVRVSYLVM